VWCLLTCACRAIDALQAPETIREGELSIACDVYAWGVLLWEMITGQLACTLGSSCCLPWH